MAKTEIAGVRSNLGKDLKSNKREDKGMARKYQVETGFWIAFVVVLLIGLGAIPLKESISASIFILLALFMLIFNKSIIDTIWSGIR